MYYYNKIYREITNIQLVYMGSLRLIPIAIVEEPDKSYTYIIELYHFS